MLSDIFPLFKNFTILVMKSEENKSIMNALISYDANIKKIIYLHNIVITFIQQIFQISYVAEIEPYLIVASHLEKNLNELNDLIQQQYLVLSEINTFISSLSYDKSSGDFTELINVDIQSKVISLESNIIMIVFEIINAIYTKNQQIIIDVIQSNDRLLTMNDLNYIEQFTENMLKSYIESYTESHIGSCIGLSGVNAGDKETLSLADERYGFMISTANKILLNIQNITNMPVI